MQSVHPQAGWQGYAVVGRPDFLNYLRRGDVTWAELWRFYREHPAEAAAMVRLMGLFHLFTSQEYDAAGCSLDRDGGVYSQLREWAQAAVALSDFVPEEKLRDSVAELLAQSLISPLYYEAVFSAYVEAVLERQARIWQAASGEAPEPAGNGAGSPVERRLTFRLPDLPQWPELEHDSAWNAVTSSLMDRHYTAWNRGYTQALGDEEEDWVDEGTAG